MMKQFIKYVWMISLLVFLGISICHGLEVPVLKKRVNDYAGLLTSTTERQLETALRDLEATDSTQIVVLTLESLEGENLEDFSMRVAESWQIGQKGLDNGALLIISIKDRKIRIEVGYGLEGTLTDLMAGRIIRNVIVPQFKSGRFDQGVTDGIQSMIQVMRGEFKATEKVLPPASRPKPWHGNVYSIIVFLFLVNMMGRIRRPLGAASGGILFPILGAIFFNLGFLWILLLIPIGAVAGLVMGLLGSPLSFSHGLTHRRSGSGFWLGGGRMGGGGFGGFSGGGGGFGGGGASGGW
jgi:uncharacterized protein